MNNVNETGELGPTSSLSTNSSIWGKVLSFHRPERSNVEQPSKQRVSMVLSGLNSNFVPVVATQ